MSELGSLRSRPYMSRTDTIAGALTLAFAMALPFLFGFDDKITGVTLQVGIYMILALGLNIVVGTTGLLDLGYVIFFATGAVLSAWLFTLTRTETGIDWPIDVDYDVEGPLLLGWPGSIFLVSTRERSRERAATFAQSVEIRLPTLALVTER